MGMTEDEIEEMENYLGNMTKVEVAQFLEDTNYEFYKNVKTPFLGLIGIPSYLDCPYCGFEVSYEEEMRRDEEFIECKACSNTFKIKNNKIYELKKAR